MKKIGSVYIVRQKVEGPDIENTGFEIHEGEIVLVTSRSLKKLQVMARILAGIEIPERGTVHTEGRPGIIMESDGLTPDSTGQEELETLAGIRGVSRKDLNEIAMRYQLTDVLGLMGSDFSEYEKLRLMLAMETMDRPSLLIMEDPFIRLSLEESRDLGEFLDELAGEGTSIVLFVRREDLYSSLSARVVDLDVRRDAKEVLSTRTERLLEGMKKDSKNAASIDTPEMEGLRLQIPVNGENDYILRRISGISYFEAVEDGYSLDIRKGRKAEVLEELRRKGLTTEEDTP